MNDTLLPTPTVLQLRLSPQQLPLWRSVPPCPPRINPPVLPTACPPPGPGTHSSGVGGIPSSAGWGANGARACRRHSRGLCLQLSLPLPPNILTPLPSTTTPLEFPAALGHKRATKRLTSRWAAEYLLCTSKGQAQQNNKMSKADTVPASMGLTV